MSHYLPDIKNVSGVQFSISSPEDIRKHSVVEVTKFETYEKDIPVIKGLFDIRMGVTERDVICNTCNQKHDKCPGHFGHIELARPVFNFHFIQMVLKLLKCVCYKCSKLLIDKESDICKLISKKPNKVRWTEIYNLCSKVKVCGQETMDGCGCIQPDNYKQDGIIGINNIYKSETDETIKKVIDVEVIKQIFEGIVEQIKTLTIFCNALENRARMMSNEMIKIDLLVSSALELRPDIERIARAENFVEDGKLDVRRD